MIKKQIKESFKDSLKEQLIDGLIILAMICSGLLFIALMILLSELIR